MIESTTHPPKKQRKIGYVRVSDHEQNQDLQIDALKQAGCTLIYGDHGITGSIIERKGLDDVLNALQSGDVLVVWKLDRLGRSTLHLFQLLDMLQSRGVDFQAVTQGIDTTTAIGRMLYGQLAVFAEFEREQIRERTIAGMQAAKARGKHIGRPRKLTEDHALEAKKQLANQNTSITIKGIATDYKVAPITLRRAIQSLKNA